MRIQRRTVGIGDFKKMETAIVQRPILGEGKTEKSSNKASEHKPHERAIKVCRTLRVSAVLVFLAGMVLKNTYRLCEEGRLEVPGDEVLHVQASFMPGRTFRE
jgi:hypothetical protein